MAFVESRKVLVTGGAGFIGSAVIRHLLMLPNVVVINVDTLTYAGNTEFLTDAAEAPSYAFECVDICDADSLRSVFDKYRPDSILHLAAESHVDRSIDAPNAFLQTNVNGTACLLQEALAYWRKLCQSERERFRFVHVSTDEVYGELTETGEPFCETTRYAPSSPYAATKAASDHLVRAWGRTYELPVIVTNSSNSYGPHQFPEKLVPHMILSALKGEPLPVYGNGQQLRDWLYVDDHARALLTVLFRGRVGENYNIGARNEQHNIEVVRRICRILESMPGAESGQYGRLITFVSDRPGHDKRYAIDPSKIERDLGWRPRETFASGLGKTVHWYLANRDWWQRVLDGTYRLQRIGIRRA